MIPRWGSLIERKSERVLLAVSKLLVDHDACISPEPEGQVIPVALSEPSRGSNRLSTDRQKPPSGGSGERSDCVLIAAGLSSWNDPLLVGI
jgi:hypothetical protein